MKLLSFIPFLFTFNLCFGQHKLPAKSTDSTHFNCGTATPNDSVRKEYTKRIKEIRLKNEVYLDSPVQIPIKAHIILNYLGVGSITSTELNNAIIKLNSDFIQMNMSFFISGDIHYIENHNFSTLSYNRENDNLVLYNVNDAINIYFTNRITGGINGISAFPSSDPTENRIIINKNATLNGETLSHEMGHFWNLYHTHQTNNTGSELVDKSNCNLAGDLVCDTPADPGGWLYDNYNCVYTGIVTDIQGEHYNPAIDNLMSYYDKCRSKFTNGQYERMNTGYALRLSLMQNHYSYDGDPTPVAAPTNIRFSSISCKELTISWNDNANNESGYIIEYRSRSSDHFKVVGRVAADVSTFQHIEDFNDISTHYYRLIASNANAIQGNITSVAAIEDCYCTPEPQNCGFDYNLNNVTLLDEIGNELINESSGCSANGYSIQDKSHIKLSKNGTYTLQIGNQMDFSPSSTNIGAAAWIDFDGDDIFEETEMILYRTREVWDTSSIKFSIPDRIRAGVTRMRVRVFPFITSSEPCDNPSWTSETEDYKITLVEECLPEFGCYCIPGRPQYGCENDFKITRVRVTESANVLLDVPSECSSSGYSIYTNTVTELTKGRLYNINISNPNSWAVGCSAWIDYNKDGDFEDSERILYISEATKWPETNINFVVPVGAQIGGSRLRIRLANDYWSLHCGNTMRGETEDYLIRIKESLCPPVLVLENVVTANQKAHNSIITDGLTIIPENSEIQFGANNYINLNPGFSTTPTASGNFIAETIGCEY